MGRTLELVARLTMAGLIAAALFVLPGPATGSADARSPGCPSATSQRPPKLGSSTCYGRRILTFRAYVQRPCTDGCGGTTAYAIAPRWLDSMTGSFVELGTGPRSDSISAFVPPSLGRCSAFANLRSCPFRPGRWAMRHGALLRPGGTNMSVLRPPARPWLREEGCDRRVQRRPRRHVDRAGRSGDRHRHGGGQGSRARTAGSAPPDLRWRAAVGRALVPTSWTAGRTAPGPGGVEASSLTGSFLPPLFGDDWCILGGTWLRSAFTMPGSGGRSRPWMALDMPRRSRASTRRQDQRKHDDQCGRGRPRDGSAAAPAMAGVRRRLSATAVDRARSSCASASSDRRGWSPDAGRHRGLDPIRRPGSLPGCWSQSEEDPPMLSATAASSERPRTGGRAGAGLRVSPIVSPPFTSSTSAFSTWGSQTVRATLGSAVSSSTPTDFQPSSAIGVSGSSPAMNLRASCEPLPSG